MGCASAEKLGWGRQPQVMIGDLGDRADQMPQAESGSAGVAPPQ